MSMISSPLDRTVPLSAVASDLQNPERQQPLENRPNDMQIHELKKIIQAQSIRNRSQSVVSESHNAPQLAPIKNFGHGRRSNLVQKA